MAAQNIHSLLNKSLNYSKKPNSKKVILFECVGDKSNHDLLASININNGSCNLTLHCVNGIVNILGIQTTLTTGSLKVYFTEPSRDAYRYIIETDKTTISSISMSLTYNNGIINGDNVLNSTPDALSDPVITIPFETLNGKNNIINSAYVGNFYADNGQINNLTFNELSSKSINNTGTITTKDIQLNGVLSNTDATLSIDSSNAHIKAADISLEKNLSANSVTASTNVTVGSSIILSSDGSIKANSLNVNEFTINQSVGFDSLTLGTTKLSQNNIYFDETHQLTNDMLKFNNTKLAENSLEFDSNHKLTKKELILNHISITDSPSSGLITVTNESNHDRNIILDSSTGSIKAYKLEVTNLSLTNFGFENLTTKTITNSGAISTNSLSASTNVTVGSNVALSTSQLTISSSYFKSQHLYLDSKHQFVVPKLDEDYSIVSGNVKIYNNKIEVGTKENTDTQIILNSTDGSIKAKSLNVTTFAPTSLALGKTSLSENNIIFDETHKLTNSTIDSELKLNQIDIHDYLTYGMITIGNFSDDSLNIILNSTDGSITAKKLNVAELDLSNIHFSDFKAESIITDHLLSNLDIKVGPDKIGGSLNPEVNPNQIVLNSTDGSIKAKSLNIETFAPTSLALGKTSLSENNIIFDDTHKFIAPSREMSESNLLKVGNVTITDTKVVVGSNTNFNSQIILNSADGTVKAKKLSVSELDLSGFNFDNLTTTSITNSGAISTDTLAATTNVTVGSLITLSNDGLITAKKLSVSELDLSGFNFDNLTTTSITNSGAISTNSLSTTTNITVGDSITLSNDGSITAKSLNVTTFAPTSLTFGGTTLSENNITFDITHKLTNSLLQVGNAKITDNKIELISNTNKVTLDVTNASPSILINGDSSGVSITNNEINLSDNILINNEGIKIGNSQIETESGLISNPNQIVLNLPDGSITNKNTTSRNISTPKLNLINTAMDESQHPFTSNFIVQNNLFSYGEITKSNILSDDIQIYNDYLAQIEPTYEYNAITMTHKIHMKSLEDDSAPEDFLINASILSIKLKKFKLDKLIVTAQPNIEFIIVYENKDESLNNIEITLPFDGAGPDLHPTTKKYCAVPGTPNYWFGSIKELSNILLDSSLNKDKDNTIFIFKRSAPRYGITASIEFSSISVFEQGYRETRLNLSNNTFLNESTPMTPIIETTLTKQINNNENIRKIIIPNLGSNLSNNDNSSIIEENADFIIDGHTSIKKYLFVGGTNGISIKPKGKYVFFTLQGPESNESRSLYTNFSNFTLKSSVDNDYDNIAIGLNSKVESAISKGIAIGYKASTYNGTNIGAGPLSKEEGQYLYLGVGGKRWNHMTTPGGEWMKPSDFRDKKDIEVIPTNKSLQFIKELSPKTFVFNYRDLYYNKWGVFDQSAYERGDKAKHRRQSGFIAQEAYQSMKNVFHDDNYADIVDYNRYDHPDALEDQYTMSKEALIPFLVGAIQEQQKQIEELKQIINTLKKS